jgi:hypothetical protein
VKRTYRYQHLKKTIKKEYPPHIKIFMQTILFLGDEDKNKKQYLVINRWMIEDSGFEILPKMTF